MTSHSLSYQTKQGFMNYLKRETKTINEVKDKLRILLIYIFCQKDINEIREMCEVFKGAHPEDYDPVFIDNVIKRRKDLDHIGD